MKYHEKIWIMFLALLFLGFIFSRLDLHGANLMIVLLTMMIIMIIGGIWILSSWSQFWDKILQKKK